jgi:hypothetical protein
MEGSGPGKTFGSSDTRRAPGNAATASFEAKPEGGSAGSIFPAGNGSAKVDPPNFKYMNVPSGLQLISAGSGPVPCGGEHV